MSSIPLCQSKNRKPGGCGDPRCPENIYLQNAINTAIDNGDIESFLTARELLPITIKRNPNGITDTLTVSEKQDASRKILGKTFKTKKIVSKEITVPSAIAASLVDKTDQPVFPSMKAVANYAKTLYGDAIMNLNVLDNYPVEGFVSLANIVVAPDSRGYGVGKHIIGMLNKSADLTGRVISLSPAVSDDGQLQRGDVYIFPDQQKYKERLEKYYTKLGYKPLTDYKTQLTEDGYRILRSGGNMVRFPNSGIPKNILKAQLSA